MYVICRGHIEVTAAAFLDANLNDSLLSIWMSFLLTLQPFLALLFEAVASEAPMRRASPPASENRSSLLNRCQRHDSPPIWPSSQPSSDSRCAFRKTSNSTKSTIRRPSQRRRPSLRRPPPHSHRVSSLSSSPHRPTPPAAKTTPFPEPPPHPAIDDDHPTRTATEHRPLRTHRACYCIHVPSYSYGTLFYPFCSVVVLCISVYGSLAGASVVIE